MIGGGDVRPFARKCGVTETSVRNYLKGTEPTLPTIIKIARACNVAVGWLAAGEENSSPQEGILAGHPEREANPRFDDLVNKTARIVTSKTIYRSALERNIDAFHKAVETEDEMQGVKEEMRGLREEIAELKALILKREPEEKRDSAANA